MNAHSLPAPLRCPEEALCRFASTLFAAAGLDPDKADIVARLLVLTDMLGRRTHGVAQCPAYLDQLASGGMTKSGAPETVRDTGPTVVWDGHYLPGLWLMDQALALGFERLPRHGVVTFAMRHSHHIGCLASLAKAATDRGFYVFIASSGPHTKAVAPYGGKAGLFSPNPLAIGFPTRRMPVLVDICATLTTISVTREKTAANELLDHPWALDSAGNPTRHPSVVERATDRGSLMLLGGQEAGHKGFGLALMVEALTQGLAGFGRKDAPTRWGASVYMQLIDPDAFAGRDAFLDQVSFFADQCRRNPPIDPERPVRLPGEQATRLVEQCRCDGVPVTPEAVMALRQWAERLGVDASVLT
jgi:LDH2 family malate/lactate/ureidoglycolate dehydrogenase